MFIILTHKLQPSSKLFLVDVMSEYEQDCKILEVDDTVTQEDVKTVSSMFNSDMILIMGKQPLTLLFPEAKENTTFDFEGISISHLFSPTRILLSSNVEEYTSDLLSHVNKTSEYKKWKNRLTSCIAREALEMTESEMEKNLTYTDVCLTYDDFKNFYEKNLKGKTKIAYDVETNAIMQTSEHYKVIGFSLSSSSDNSCYVVFESLDYKMPEEDKKKINKIVKEILVDENIKILVYNCKHELLASLSWLDVKMENVQDLFIWTKLLRGQSSEYQGSAGLKYQVSTLLGYPDWSKDLNLYRSMVLASAWRKPRVNSVGFKKDDYVFYGNELFISTTDNNLSEPSTNSEWRHASFKDVLSKYYEKEELDEVIDLINKHINEIRTEPDIDIDTNEKEKYIDYGFSFAYIPYKLISKYGGLDASSLFDLEDYQQRAARKEEKEMGIDLQIGYENWYKNHYAGYILERNGIYWDEKRVKELEEWCINSQLDSLKLLIKHPISEKIIYENIWSIAIPSIIQELGSDSIKGFQVIRKNKQSLSVEALTEDAETWMQKRCQEKDKRGRYKVNQELFGQMIKSKLVTVDFDFEKEIDRFIEENKDDVNGLKYLFNPGSTLITEHCASKLTTDELKKANTFLELENYIKSDSFVMKDESPEDQEMLEIIMRREYEVIGDDEYEDSFEYRHKKFLEFEKNYLKKGSKFNSLSLGKKKIIARALSFEVPDLTKSTLWNTFYLYSILGIDCDDESTWNEQFEWLWNFKLFKRCDKYLSTYINGNRVGRGNAYRVRQEDLLNNKMLAKRQEKYEYSDVESPFILQTNYNPCTVSTGRWSSGFHTVPAGDTGKRFYTSRFKNGLIIDADGQAMEVRALAAACGDKGLLTALKNGLDVHSFTASKVFDKHISQVTPYERWLSKGLTFGLLYGESVQSVANSFCEGDLARAEAVFEIFFTAFPTIKGFIERCHEQFKETGKVSMITNRSIKVEGNNRYKADDFNSCLRQSQNYPIQGSASDTTGLILWKINDEIEKRNYYSKIISMIHDSNGTDTHPQEFFPMIDVITDAFKKYPLEILNMPVDTDVVFGPSLAQEIEIIKFEHDDKYQENILTLSGLQDDMNEVFTLWKDEYKEIKILEEGEVKDNFISKDTVFLKSCSMFMGTNKKKVKDLKVRVIV